MSSRATVLHIIRHLKISNVKCRKFRIINYCKYILKVDSEGLDSKINYALQSLRKEGKISFNKDKGWTENVD